MIKKCLTLVFLFFFMFSFSQVESKVIDSLKVVLEKIPNKSLMNKKAFAVNHKIAEELSREGYYKEALKILFNLYKSAEQNKKSNIATYIANNYYYLNQYKNAEYYYQKSIDYANSKEKINAINNLAVLKLNLKKYTETETLLNSVDIKNASLYALAGVYSTFAELEKIKGNLKKSESYYQKIIEIDKKDVNKQNLANDYLAMATMYFDFKKYDSAEKKFIESYNILIKSKDENAKKMVLQYLIEMNFEKNGNTKYQFFFNKYNETLKNIINKNIQESTNEFNLKFRTAEKEAKIKTQQLEIQKAKANRNMAFAGIGTLILLSGAGFWLYRNKQNQKQLQSQNTLLGLQQNLNAMQLDNLNKQLDPHEIKNILANISPEIQRNAPDAYNKMTKLLNLTRASLSSNSITDSIENQLQQIEDYLSLEKTVLPVPLHYTIKNEVTTNKQIPRLLLKNLVENSIKHGIKNKKEGGEINIILSETDNKIKITVDDTGIGRQQAISLDSGIGTSTYINLFETLNKTNTQKASFNIIDKEQGTTVEIIIPNNYIYS